MEKVLITGATGFIGKNLTAYLSDNYEINPLCIRYGASSQTIIIRDDFVVHLAGKAHDLKQISSPAEYYEANFELTKFLYDGFLRSNAKKFIYLSSVKAVADSVDCILNETAVPSPQTVYGKSKLMAEAYIMSKPLPEGKFFYILRPCMVHGPHNKGNLNLLYALVKKGLPYPLGAFENRRSFLSIDNLCYVINQLIEKDIPNGIYNVCDDESLSTNELIVIMAEAMSKPLRIWRWNKSLVRFCAQIGNILHLPLNEERLHKLTGNYVVSNAKLKRALGIEKMPVPAIKGLLKTIQSFEKILSGRSLTI